MRRLIHLLALIVLVPACRGPAAAWFDYDGDGSPDHIDCAPRDPDVHPAAIDLVGDGRDLNCDDIDGTDLDGDGQASVASGGLDCNDADRDVYTGALEEPDDGIDNDCDDGDLVCDADEDDLKGPQCDGPDCDDTHAGCAEDCVDDDGDGVAVCAGDCDDGRDDVHPGADEVCDGVDSDCDEELPEVEEDGDGDGSLPCDAIPDCDPADPLRFPGNPEVCDGLDNDCDPATWADGLEQDGDGDGSLSCLDCDENDPVRHRLDLDGDGVDSCDGDCNDNSELFAPGADDWAGDGADTNCDGVPGIDGDHDHVAGTDSGGTDCRDDDDSIHPGATEVCDAVDQDCDGLVDEDFDLDGDGSATCAGDCDDADATVAPDAAELCDGLDNDCDAAVPPDEVDSDGDGFLACADCDDASPSTWPGAAESCDGTDEDCDASIDEDFDQDGDGVTTCAGDCDDDNAFVWPGEPEACDGLDNDCDPTTESVGGEADADGDQHLPCDGFADHGALSVTGLPLVGGGDCDDSQPFVRPGHYEYCDGLDNDCDPATSASWGEDDGDGDGYLACASFVDHGAVPALLGGLDCDDDNPFRYGGAAEVCDGWDNDCDLAAPGESDADEDRYLSCTGFIDHGAINPAAEPLLGGGDCEEGQPHRFPGNPEVCDGHDNDCDPATDATFDEWDADGDAWVACEDFVDHGASNTSGDPIEGGLDCDDGLATANPGLVAQWEDPDDGVDTGCDGFDANQLTPAIEDASVAGLLAEARLGEATAVGDVDGDGLDDLLISAPSDSLAGNNTGRVFLVLGADLAAGGALTTDDAAAVFVGEGNGDDLGEAVAVGDVDGDGLDDVVLASNDTYGGTVWVISGARATTWGSTPLADADAILLGDYGGDEAGTAVALGGDVDGDGLADLLVSAPYFHRWWTVPQAGAVYLVTGSALAAGGTSSLADAHAIVVGYLGDHPGDGLAWTPDLDGDGLHDALVGGPRVDGADVQSGRTWLVSGATLAAGGTSSLEDAHAEIIGADWDGQSGQVVAAGDLTGDGLAELVIGSRSDSLWIVHGADAAAGGDISLADAWVRIDPEVDGDRLGHAVAVAPDMDGDGRAELLVGAQWNDEGGSGAGKAYLFLGATLDGGGTFGAVQADLAAIGEFRLVDCGAAVATGDFDGDGMPDLALSSPQHGALGAQAGRVDVVWSPL